MSDPADTGALADDRSGAIDQVKPAQARLFVYSTCLAISFALYLFAHGLWGKSLFLVAVIVASGGIAAGLLSPTFARHNRLFRMSVALAVVLAIAVPLGPQMVSQTTIAGTAIWPQILVALFGSRVLAEVLEIRFADQWRNPLEVRNPVPVQSIAAAAALGACLTLLFYEVASHVGATDGSASGIIRSALLGETVIHRAIIFLFFVIVAFLVDAALLYFKDRTIVAAIRASSRQKGGLNRAALRRLLDAEYAPLGHSRAVRTIRDLLDHSRVSGTAPEGRSAALAGFHQASRRFVRGLIPFLPLLGFLGTVIGLSIALAELPHGLATDQRAGFDIGGSLAGLAVKFETTLLGLIASMFASLLLGVLEKAEAELAAECSLLVDAADLRGGSDGI